MKRNKMNGKKILALTLPGFPGNCIMAVYGVLKDGNIGTGNLQNKCMKQHANLKVFSI